SDSRAEDGRQYLVPYVVWANYELGDVSFEVTSLNYLQAVLMDAAGLPLTGYQQYLLDLQQEYPVISSQYVIPADGRILPTESCTDELSEYRSMMYNHMSDISHNPPGFFNYR
ncbi:MAG: LTA synthase family protein, partial [Lachnospiraceae bacterium]|nr:LTA synthase family protein [Lachnospiraceae bacterium]